MTKKKDPRKKTNNVAIQANAITSEMLRESLNRIEEELPHWSWRGGSIWGRADTAGIIPQEYPINKEDEKVDYYSNLQNVIVVNQKKKILLDMKVVAGGREEAIFEADVSSILKSQGLSYQEVTIIVNDLGPVKVED